MVGPAGPGTSSDFPMRPSLKNLSRKAHDAAAGSPVPAGQEPPGDDAAPTPTTGERGSMRKRVRRLARLREVQLRELGALVVEMRRLGRDNPDLVARKAAELLALDEELRSLRAALGERDTVEQVVAAGVAGTCRRCDTLMSTEDRFCPHCGLGADEAYPRAPEAEAEPQQPAEPQAPAEAAAPPPPPPPPPPPDAKDADGAPPTDREQTELTATAPPRP
jgi:hypothetical protein